MKQYENGKNYISDYAQKGLLHKTIHIYTPQRGRSPKYNRLIFYPLGILLFAIGILINQSLLTRKEGHSARSYGEQISNLELDGQIFLSTNSTVLP